MASELTTDKVTHDAVAPELATDKVVTPEVIPLPRIRRKLCSIQRLKFLRKIEGKDMIVLGQVLGYQLIVRVDEFFTNSETKEVDLSLTPLVAYFETDTLLDNANPVFAFLKSRGFRVRTLNMAGVCSEGLAMSLQKLELPPMDEILEEGLDLTKITRTKKYLNRFEKNDRKRQKTGGGGGGKGKKQSNDLRMPVRPKEIPRTDEPNGKSNPYLLGLMKATPIDAEGNKVERRVTVTMKLDGCSTTFHNGRVFSRNFEHVEIDGTYNVNAVLYVKIMEKLELDETTKKYPQLAISGELVGPGANNNRLGLEELDFFVFNIFHVVDGCYLPTSQVLEICKDLGLKHVPIFHQEKTIAELGPDYASIESMSAFSDTLLYESNNSPAEGIVIRTSDEWDKDPRKRYSFKVVSKKYLAAIK